MSSDMQNTALALPKPPPQLTNGLTGYPIWRSPYPGWDAQQLNAVVFMSFAGILFGVALSVKYVQRTHAKMIQDTNRNLSVFFSTLITFYITATFITVTGFWFIDVGKLWVAVGVLHNAMEFAILMCLGFAKNMKAFDYFYGALFAYWAWTQGVAIMLPWPHDAIYFKFQGLIFDYALVINFYRLMRANSPSALGHITLGNDPDAASSGKISSSQNQNQNRILASNPDYDGSSSSSSPPIQSKNERNGDLWIVWVAAIIHLIGNCITVVSLSKYPFLVFQFTYGITYPMYGYYVARQPGGQSRILWYESNKKTELLVFGVSVIGAIVTSVIGIAVGLAYYNGGEHP